MNNLTEDQQNQNYIFDVSENDFGDKIIAASEEQLILVDFWAPWCGPCKQLTPVLEKIINNSKGKVLLAKLNIDENQQIAAQLRIQSIPAVFAFKDKKMVNAFQGVIPEKQIIEFIEKCLGEELYKDNSEFYKTIENLIENDEVSKAKESLEEYMVENSSDIIAIKLYLECLVALSLFDNAKDFISSLSDEIQNTVQIKSIISSLSIKEKNLNGPSIEEIKLRYKKNPKNIDVILELAEKYFADKKIDESFELLLHNFSKSNQKDKDKIKNSLIKYFEILGNNNDKTKSYRKRLSSIMFS
tara:strand:+ start:124 stop:1023 length:900 start_codon:yes stop_codon:yes gene_type:complete